MDKNALQALRCNQEEPSHDTSASCYWDVNGDWLYARWAQDDDTAIAVVLNLAEDDRLCANIRREQPFGSIFVHGLTLSDLLVAYSMDRTMVVPMMESLTDSTRQSIVAQEIDRIMRNSLRSHS